MVIIPVGYVVYEAFVVTSSLYPEEYISDVEIVVSSFKPIGLFPTDIWIDCGESEIQVTSHVFTQG